MENTDRVAHVELMLRIEPDEFTETQGRMLASATAALLGIALESVEVAPVDGSGVRVRVRLPEERANSLLDMHEKGGDALRAFLGRLGLVGLRFCEQGLAFAQPPGPGTPQPPASATQSSGGDQRGGGLRPVITEVKVQPVDEPRLKALVWTVFENGLVVRGIKIIRVEGRLIVAMPSARHSNVQYCDATSETYRRYLEETILRAYEGRLEGSQPR
jgi:DNA-binding cell septation regulator SpoVG